MFMFMMMLAFASAVVELTLASKFPAWRKAAKRNKAINMIISIALSFVLGIMFGAAGLIAMAAAMISTAISIPGYAVLEWAYDSPEAQKHGGNLFKYYTQRWKIALTDLVNLTYKIIKIITAPIWITRAIIEKVIHYTNKVKSYRMSRS